MAFWWVNHNQTYRQEIEGGYIWSPKANKNGARNETARIAQSARIACRPLTAVAGRNWARPFASARQPSFGDIWP